MNIECDVGAKERKLAFCLNLEEDGFLVIAQPAMLLLFSIHLNGVWKLSPAKKRRLKL